MLEDLVTVPSVLIGPPSSSIPPSDQVQRGTAVTPAPWGFRRKCAATPLLATETWQSPSMPNINQEAVGGGGGETEIEVEF